MAPPPVTAGCWCGRPTPYDDCCGRLHRGEAHAPTAEALMRSRYSAFAVGDAAYLDRTWHPDTRPRRIHLGDDRTWTGLEVLATSGGGLLDQEGTVEFEAHHHRTGANGVVHADGVLHERSRFSRVGGRWVYVGPAG